MTRAFGAREIINACACELRIVTLTTLRAHLETNVYRELYRSYTANRLWEIMQALYSGKNEVQPYSEIIKIATGKKEIAPQDNRSAQEIKQSIMDKLKGVKHNDAI